MTAITAVIELVECWLADLGYATLDTPRAPRIGRAAYALEWQLCRLATWLRNEDGARR